MSSPGADRTGRLLLFGGLLAAGCRKREMSVMKLDDADRVPPIRRHSRESEPWIASTTAR